MINNPQVDIYVKKREKRIVRRRWLLIASIAVALITSYALIFPAVTMETKVECGMEEHVHDMTDCYSQDGMLTCEKSEHWHQKSCYPVEYNSLADLEKDVEKSEDWEKTLENITRSGNWGEDVIAVAKSQLGYTESGKNYCIDEQGQIKGYTRYGQWYGEPYADWNILFVAFCLRYAQVPQNIIPTTMDCRNWIEGLSASDKNRYIAVNQGTPMAGDLVFLDKDRDCDAETIAIITDVIYDETSNVRQITAIEGDCDHQVQSHAYVTDGTIVGYGILTERTDVVQSDQKTTEAQQLEEYVVQQNIVEESLKKQVFLEQEEETAFTYTQEEKSYKDNQVIITAQYDASARIPDQAELVAYPVTKQDYPERFLQRQQETKAMMDIAMEGEEGFLYNIGFFLDGEEIEPQAPVTISLQFLTEEGIQVGTPVTIIHFSDDGTEVLPGANVIKTQEGNAVTTFETDSFSDFMVIPTPYAATDDVVEISQATYSLYPSQNALATYLNNTSFNGTLKLIANLSVSSTYTLGSGRNITIDLNGHNITASTTFLNVSNGATVEIIDSVAPQIQETVLPAQDTYGTVATYTSSTNTLNYYVTRTEVSEEQTGATVETHYRYQVRNEGVLTCTSTSAACIVMTKGTLRLNSGMIAGCSNRAIDVSGGTLELNGGYLCGNKVASAVTPNEGGAITAQDSNQSVIIRCNGTVIAANRAQNGGAIALTDKSNAYRTELYITGGIISGNTAELKGGGIFATDATIVMEDGYLTNNLVTDEAYYSGGGGVALAGSTKFTLNHGYITANKAQSRGAGCYADTQATAQFIMNGGFVTGNYAVLAEGGGVCINSGCMGVWKNGYVTNNKTGTDEHWGGGGIFISEDATGYLTGVLVTNNTADGFGGGVAGCSTGRIYMSAIEYVSEGTAIYDNMARGIRLSGGESSKHEDHTYAAQNAVFMENEDYQDYFCMLYSQVRDGMLGGGSEDWHGCIDGVKVVVPYGDERTGNSVVGLRAYPTQEDKNAAQAAASLYINGNASGVHGGGILCNGYMVLGKVDESLIMELGTRMEVYGTKQLLSAAGANISTPEHQFSFRIDDEWGYEVARGTNDTNGDILFDRRIVFDEAGTHIYYIQEEPCENSAILTDMNRYRLEVVTERRSNGLIDGTIQTYVQHIASVRLFKQDKGGGSWNALDIRSPDVSKEVSTGVKLYMTSGATFVNYQLSQVDIRAYKNWVGTPKSPITLDLYRNDVLLRTQEVTNDNNWETVYENYSGTSGIATIPLYGARGRYLKLYCISGKDSSTAPRLREIEVRDTSGSGSNIAKGKTVQATSSYNSTYNAAKAVDGNSSTYWRAGSTSNQSIIIDFGKVVDFSEVVLNWHTEYSTSYHSKEYQIQVQTDPNIWTYAWRDLPVDDGNGNFYSYSVKERHVDGYLTEYEMGMEGQYRSYWVPVTTLKAGEKYMLIDENSGNALTVTADHSLGHFDNTDVTNISSKKGNYSISFGGNNYSNWYAEDKITDARMIFTAQEYGTGIGLKNVGNTDSWLCVRPDDGWGKYLSGVPSSGSSNEPSLFQMYNGKLRGRCSEDSSFYYIYYGENSLVGFSAFNANKTDQTSKNVKLYQLVNTPIEGTRIVNITNTAIADALFTLDITKRSSKDHRTPLRGAQFQLKKRTDNSVVYFIKVDKEYRSSTRGVSGATTLLSSDEHGKIKITGLKAGDYILQETKPPAGYYEIEDYEIALNENIHNTTMQIILEDDIIEYELPKTGGDGYNKYTMVGFLLIISMTYLLYKNTKMKEEIL